MKNNKTIVVLIILLFSLGIVVGSFMNTNNKSLPEFEEEVTNEENEYEEMIVINETSNLFVKVAKGLEKICKKIITFIFGLVQKIFEGIFGTNFRLLNYFKI